MPLVSRTPQRVDVELYAGDGCAIRLRATDPAGATFPLDGQVTAQIRARRTDPDPASADWAVDDSDASNGVVLISLSGDQTAALVDSGIPGAPPSVERWTGVWDVQFRPGGGEPITLLQGAVTCNADVTRP